MNIMNKQSRTADKGRSSSLGIGRGADNSLSYNWPCLETDTCASDTYSFILWYDLSNGKGT